MKTNDAPKPSPAGLPAPSETELRQAEFMLAVNAVYDSLLAAGDATTPEAGQSLCFLTDADGSILRLPETAPMPANARLIETLRKLAPAAEFHACPHCRTQLPEILEYHHALSGGYGKVWLSVCINPSCLTVCATRPPEESPVPFLTRMPRRRRCFSWRTRLKRVEEAWKKAK